MLGTRVGPLTHSAGIYLTIRIASLQCTKVPPYEADSHAVGADREINKSTEVSPFPPRGPEYSLGFHEEKSEDQGDDGSSYKHWPV